MTDPNKLDPILVELVTVRVRDNLRANRRWQTSLLVGILGIGVGLMGLGIWSYDQSTDQLADFRKSLVKQATPSLESPDPSASDTTLGVNQTDTVEVELDSYREFRIEVDSLGWYRIGARGLDGFDPVIDLYYSGGSLFLSNDDGTDLGLDSRIVAQLDPTEPYILRVRGFIGQPGTVEVSLVVER